MNSDACLLRKGGDYQPVLAMETKPSELGEMEDESLVAQVPCEPGVVTTAIPREVPGGAGAL